MHQARRSFFLGLVFATSAWADYGWIPKHEHLQTRLGFDFASSSSNYNDLGQVVAPTVSGQPITLQDQLLWLEPEYGIVDDWSVGFKLGLLGGSASTSSGAVAASGSGITDLRGSLKWQFADDPIWTVEGIFKLPSGNAIATTATELVTGDGNIDIGAKLHYGMQAGNFFLSASPGFLARTGGFSPALTLDVAGQMFINRAYAKAFVHSVFSLSSQALPPSTVAAQTLSGTGGSYARLAASPTLIVAGANVGLLISKQFRLEAGFSRSVWGQRAPESLIFTVSLLGLFDLSKPDLRPKVHEVPFESSPADP